MDHSNNQIRLNKPVRVAITGEDTTGSAILTVGSDPLPNSDNAVTVILFGLGISVTEDCNVQIKSNDVVLYEKNFVGATTDNISDIVRKGAPTHDMKLFISGVSLEHEIVLIADVGFEYNGGAMNPGASNKAGRL